MLGGIIITQSDLIKLTRREQLYTFMNQKDLGDHELRFVQKWVSLIIEGSDVHALKDGE